MSTEDTQKPPESEPLREAGRGDLVKALAKAKKSFKPVVKNREVKAGAYSYKYAELSHILDAVTPALNDNDLILTQDIMGDSLVTRLMHASGQVIKSTMPIVAGGKPGPQGHASSVTYARRYSVCNLLCLSADDDLDAADVQHEHVSAAPGPKQGSPPAFGGDSRAITEPQVNRLMAIAGANGWTEADIKAYLSQIGLKSRKELTRIQYDKLCDNMQKFPKEKV